MPTNDNDRDRADEQTGKRTACSSPWGDTKCTPNYCEHRVDATEEEILDVLEEADAPLATHALAHRVGKRRGCGWPRLNVPADRLARALTALTGKGAIISANGHTDAHTSAFGKPLTPEDPVTARVERDLQYWMTAEGARRARRNAEAERNRARARDAVALTTAEDVNGALQVIGLDTAAWADDGNVTISLPPDQVRRLMRTAARGLDAPTKRSTCIGYLYVAGELRRTTRMFGCDDKRARDILIGWLHEFATQTDNPHALDFTIAAMRLGDRNRPDRAMSGQVSVKVVATGPPPAPETQTGDQTEDEDEDEAA